MSTKKVPLRMCVSCGEMRPKKELLRMVKTPEGAIELDFTGKKNGRGAYICKKKECLEKAMKKHSLERSLKVAIPDEIYDSLKEELNRIE